MSEGGSFKTAPPPGIADDVRFAYSGDSDGTETPIIPRPFPNNFAALDAARGENLDFFVYLGDTIYSDSGLRSTPAQTLPEYRDAYKVNREIAALRNLLRDTSIFWDDHEVHDDFDGETVDPDRYAAGREAFLEYMPVVNLPLHDPSCAGTPLFRIFRWGKDVDIIILDERSCRSADVEPVCPGVLGLPDLAPTLPGFLRAAPQFSAFFPLPPPPGCLEAIADPDRTMLGRRQKRLFKTALLESRAKFKFVINQVPIQQFYFLPYDRWEGYAAERAEILNFIRDHNIENVIFLTTDAHRNQINAVFIDRFLDPQPLAHEFITGPIATFTTEQEILNVFGPDLTPTVVTAVHQIFSLVGVECRHLNALSYGLVEVNGSAGTATITLKDDAGMVISDQLNSNIQCSKTIGP